MDFPALPPEVNSGRIYTGPGPQSLTAAAGAWQILGEELESAANSINSILDGLAQAWQGPTGAAMMQAADGYFRWLRHTATMAAATASQAGRAAQAFNNVKLAVVPPSTIAANRASVLKLSSVNIFGQATQAIMALEAQYDQMWAQDVAAMNNYAVSSQAATSQLQPFTQAPSDRQPRHRRRRSRDHRFHRRDVSGHRCLDRRRSRGNGHPACMADGTHQRIDEQRQSN